MHGSYFRLICAPVRYTTAGLRLGIFFIFCICIASAAKPEPTGLQRLKVIGVSETVFEWRLDACTQWDVPDVPARAFRDRAGLVHLIASWELTRASVGADLNHLKHQCPTIFGGGESAKPDAFDWYAWLTSFYTEDGQTVYALVHNEFHGDTQPSLCPFQVYIRCWRNAITFATSSDGGFSFVQPQPPQNVVASLPYRYDGRFGKQTGYFGPTNIIKYDGFYYALFYATAYGAQKLGFCLMRTDRLDDPTSWRAWDGKAFSVKFINPYTTDEPEPGKHVCEPVGQGQLLGTPGSLVRRQSSGEFILVMAGWEQSPSGLVEGVFASTSHDLINWTGAKPLWEVPIEWDRECRSESFGYPSLLDPDSTSRNFETVGTNAYLYVTQFHLVACKPTTNRDLVRLKVQLE